MSTHARCSMMRKRIIFAARKVVCALPCMICSDPFVSINRSKCNLSKLAMISLLVLTDLAAALKWRTSLHLINALARIKLWFPVTLLLSMIGCMHPYRLKDQSFQVPFDCWQMPSVPATSCRHKASWNVVARRLTLLIIGLLLTMWCVFNCTWLNIYINSTILELWCVPAVDVAPGQLKRKFLGFQAGGLLHMHACIWFWQLHRLKCCIAIYIA